MTPPKLATDAPVLDVLEPCTIGILVFLRDEFNDVVHHGAERNFGEVLHVDEPLQRQTRLDGHLGAL